ncbi:helix-turn-helix transcriptional regulator [Rhizorhabdus wittichii]|uniref:Helix-turn-helix transcriptional regulator n=1 Tax=Rhizorhabdus wittichii TaxID=160791 RepID=A0A975HE10_9SPHN|nr:helix-turn-helix transcriptional regulator [Rhizorhabdus wittichii]QTH21976.1 helix-turn-helix transcriptional regulator [Rhizorhabdus wittichii]
MKLKSYLTEQRVSYADFAQQIGVANAGVVAKYIDGSRIPRASILRRITLVTGGAVQLNDFFDPPADKAPTDQVEAA